MNDRLPQVAQGGYDCKDKVEMLPRQPEVGEKKFVDNFCQGEIGVQSSAQQSTGHEGQDGQAVGRVRSGEAIWSRQRGMDSVACRSPSQPPCNFVVQVAWVPS